jgi:cytochrome c-type biogenesis protein CcmH/NrfG
VETSIHQPASGGRPRLSKNAYVMAVVCLALGMPIGYFARGLRQPNSDGSHNTAKAAAPASERAQMQRAQPTMDQMKRMADKAAAPLLEQLRNKPNDPTLLAAIAQKYFKAHQFSEAISYAERAVQADPKHIGNRADLASFLYLSDRVDDGIAQLEEALRNDPDNPQVLFNLGMMRWKGKNDAIGAVKLWKEMLAKNSNLPESHKRQVEKAIEQAKRSPQFLASGK